MREILNLNNSKMQNALSMSEIQSLDREIDQLMECKPLTETEVKQLCDKARSALTRLGEGAAGKGVECAACSRPCYRLR